MARKPRIQFGGAIYHLIGRGNYKKDLFDQEGAAYSFELSLEECAVKCGWLVHAYVLMTNHYHLVVETPTGNLVEGMRWLLGVFGNRFNRFRNESGHVFQGRYKALLVEPGASFLRVVDYVHLNPARSGLIPLDQLDQYSRSSLPKHLKSKRPEWLRRDLFLEYLELSNDRKGMLAYLRRLRSLEELHANRSQKLSNEMCRGWMIGTQGFRKALAKEFEQMELAQDWGGAELREINEELWKCVLVEALKQVKKTPKDIESDRKNAPWKREIAIRLRKETSASNGWIAEQLNAGHPSLISRWATEKSNIKG